MAEMTHSLTQNENGGLVVFVLRFVYNKLRLVRVELNKPRYLPRVRQGISVKLPISFNAIERNVLLPSTHLVKLSLRGSLASNLRTPMEFYMV